MVVIQQPELPSALMHLVRLSQRNGYQLRFIYPVLKAVHDSLGQAILLSGSFRNVWIFVAGAPECVPHRF